MSTLCKSILSKFKLGLQILFTERWSSSSIDLFRVWFFIRGHLFLMSVVFGETQVLPLEHSLKKKPEISSSSLSDTALSNSKALDAILLFALTGLTRPESIVNCWLTVSWCFLSVERLGLFLELCLIVALFACFWARSFFFGIKSPLALNSNGETVRKTAVSVVKPNFGCKYNA